MCFQLLLDMVKSGQAQNISDTISTCTVFSIFHLRMDWLKYILKSSYYAFSALISV